jgi:hypothetical protein
MEGTLESRRQTLGVQRGRDLPVIDETTEGGEVSQVSARLKAIEELA